VLDFVKNNCNVDGLEILRPFYPGGDFENFNYPDNSVVVDNPPFSIISKIIRFYNDRGVKYFLFAPQLTLFSPDQEYTAIVADASIIYENGANVKTSFVSNLFGEKKIIGSPELYRSLKKINEDNKVNKPCYQYPHNVVTVSQIAQIVSRGEYIEIDKKDVVYCRGLDHQKSLKKGIFGCGFLISDAAANTKAAAEKAAAENKKDKNVIFWQLSEREKEIIKSIS
ncbi:chromosome partitioning protein ParB, partial [Chryseobacterium artocarpi]|uniref:chromosome partitioning protein ParB n=1 Tax=Chryseobacterium artocarpi TaxID=1414727 RepID=UPI003F3962EB